MLILATEDIPETQLGALSKEFRDLGGLELDESRAFHRSAEPPSWIAMFEQANVWILVLGSAAAVFLNELLKEAAKDTWRNKEAIARALAKPAVLPLRVAAAAIARFRGLANPRTSVDVGIPLPDDFFGTRLQLTGQSTDAIALELALFVQHCGAIQELLSEAEQGVGDVAGPVTLSLLGDGSMRIEWMDANLDPRTLTLPPPLP
jgi:hypothetical protein